MVAQPIEVEAKFICPSNLTKEALERILLDLDLTVTWQPPVNQVDIYLDTLDYKLFNDKASLRIRHIKERYVGTFKTPKRKDDFLFERDELS